ncbi:MAG TPA: efflux RND transporter periplasmic adaptor subunit [Burkholderiaceae bacterium]|nr:efflux RND transporter periplasmic adaptor subunit [Burkholderiaceae bacterium]
MTEGPALHRVHPDPRAGLILTCAVLVLLAGCQKTSENIAPEVRPVRATKIDTSTVDGMVMLTGTIQAQTEINQSFRIDGRLVERAVDIGDNVRPGQLIARLDPQNEESALQSARAQLAGANAQLVEARANYSRMAELVVENAVSRAQYDQAKALLQSAEAQVLSVQGQVNLAQNRLSYTRLFADVAGVVTARGPEPGEVVSAGRMVVQVAREGARDAVFDVPAQIKDAAPLDPKIAVNLGREGKSVGAPDSSRDLAIALAMNPKVTATGRVREVAPRADPVTGTFAVRVRLINPPAAMRLGSTVTGRMRLEGSPGISLPSSAMMRADGKTAVWIVDPKASTVSLRSIALGATDATTVQVTSGLNAGDVVVTAGVQALRPGQKVRLIEN